MDHMSELMGWLLLFAVAALAARFVFYWLHRLRLWAHRLIGTADLLEAVSQMSQEAADTPRSLNACEGSVLPRILEEFPDFDLNLVKTYARDYINQQLADKDGLVIHNVVLSEYLTQSVQRAVVLQAAVSWMEETKLQKRFDLTYTYKLDGGKTAVGANCPNCGATIGYGQRECPYCGSRVINALGQTWQFTEMRET